MLIYPHINPEILHIAGPFAIRWYGVAYLAGFLGAWYLGLKRLSTMPCMSKAQFSDLICALMIGVIVGGRVGYVLFYNTAVLWTAPWEVAYLWQGGMSFHGGVLGVVWQTYRFGRRQHISFLALTDFITPLIPIGLFFGRGANFINGELWGRVTDVPWAMIFPHVDLLPRHPSQLYEMATEGALLFLLMQCITRRVRPEGLVSGVFLLGYGIIRFMLEFVREPDPQLGLLIGSLTMGQILSIPMLLLGLYLCMQAQTATQRPAVTV
jgi:phosphatidylglycerol:prolipoprotein diacylglycerol transferase